MSHDPRDANMAAYSNKEIAKHYFVATDIPKIYQCVCHQLRKQTAKTGYGNLASHVKTNHKDYEEQIQSKIRAGAGSILSFIDDKSRSIFYWNEWVVEGNHSRIIFPYDLMLTCIFINNLMLNFVEKPNTRKNVRLKTISMKHLKKYMQLLT